ncbi:MAG: hypothetical protein JSS49_27475 [Planctomycetes bacterium]|nr:hypothetical protein [Planctomycetota bacterium]
MARSGLVEETGKPYVLGLDSWKVTGTGAALGATAGTPSGAFGLTVGTFGTNSPKIAGEAASGASKTNKMRRQFALPVEYVGGGNITVRVKAQETVGAATVSTTIDMSVYKVDKAAGIGADLCATNAQDVTTAAANADFSVTPTGLVAGDVLDIEVNVVTNDTGGTVGTIVNIFDTEILLDVQG